jgi:hypothetical protein
MIEPASRPESKNGTETEMIGRVSVKSFFMTSFPAALWISASGTTSWIKGLERSSFNLTLSNSHRSGLAWMMFPTDLARKAASTFRVCCDAIIEVAKYILGIAMAKTEEKRAPRTLMSIMMDAFDFDCTRWE